LILYCRGWGIRTALSPGYFQTCDLVQYLDLIGAMYTHVSAFHIWAIFISLDTIELFFFGYNISAVRHC
jgi:hypothetical protein